MRSIRVYEPALCCNTGVCGPELDQDLVTFTADLNYLKDQGADAERHNLANDPAAFADNPAVREFLQVAGSDRLPLTVVDGVTVMTGGYPTRAQLVGYAGLTVPGDLTLDDPAKDGSTRGSDCEPVNTSEVCCQNPPDEDSGCCTPAADTAQAVPVGATELVQAQSSCGCGPAGC